MCRLFQIDDRDLQANLLVAQANVNVAEANLAQAKNQLQRAENVPGKPVISLEELQNRRGAVAIGRQRTFADDAHMQEVG